MESLRSLEGCSVVEGSVKIVQIDDIPEDDLQKLSFPLLTEITDFLIIYRVSNLKTVSQLFPNLARIHGQKLYRGYAMVLFENPNLEKVDLTELKSIAKGAVRIERNEMLCFVHTVNWTSIEDASEYHPLNFIQVS